MALAAKPEQEVYASAPAEYLAGALLPLLHPSHCVRLPQVPYTVLRFLFTEINYGGRVTDDKDRRLMAALIQRFCGPQARPGPGPGSGGPARGAARGCLIAEEPRLSAGWQVPEDGYSFAPSGTYITPACETIKEVRRLNRTAHASQWHALLVIMPPSRIPSSWHT